VQRGVAEMTAGVDDACYEAAGLACLGAVVRAGWGHGEGRHGVVLGDCVWQAAAVCQGRQCCVEVVTR